MNQALLFGECTNTVRYTYQTELTPGSDSIQVACPQKVDLEPITKELEVQIRCSDATTVLLFGGECWRPIADLIPLL